MRLPVLVIDLYHGIRDPLCDLCCCCDNIHVCALSFLTFFLLLSIYLLSFFSIMFLLLVLLFLLFVCLFFSSSFSHVAHLCVVALCVLLYLDPSSSGMGFCYGIDRCNDDTEMMRRRIVEGDRRRRKTKKECEDMLGLLLVCTSFSTSLPGSFSSRRVPVCCSSRLSCFFCHCDVVVALFSVSCPGSIVCVVHLLARTSLGEWGCIPTCSVVGRADMTEN